MVSYFEFILILIIIALGVWVWKLYQEKQVEKEEKVKQVGKTGKNVFYQIAKNIQ